MSDLKPSGPAQPSLQQGYETSGNPAQQQPAEKATAAANASDNSQVVDQRVPTKQTSSSDEATPSSLGRGIQGAPPGEEAKGETEESVGRHNELEGEQMRAPGEGEVASVVDRKPGASGEQEDLAGNLDEKKAEQEHKKADRPVGSSEKVDVQSILKNR